MTITQQRHRGAPSGRSRPGGDSRLEVDDPGPSGAPGRGRRYRRWLAHAVAVVAVVVGAVDEPTLIVGFVICALVFIPLEQLLPLVPRAGLRRSAWVDLAHAFGNRLPITLGIGALLALTAPVVHGWFPEEWRQQVLALPPWAQFAVLLLVTDLINYACHRMLHEVPLLWRLHAVHHSSTDLDWLATSRGHPLDQILNVTAITLPLHVLGSDQVLSAAFVTFSFFYPFLAHANTTITLRWLSPVFVTPAFHHWHHANEPEAVNTNYGTIFSFWDRLFGSWHLPRRMPRAYGIDEPMPDTWVGQLAEPFRPRPGPPPEPPPPLDRTLWRIDARTARRGRGRDGTPPSPPRRRPPGGHLRGGTPATGARGAHPRQRLEAAPSR